LEQHGLKHPIVFSPPPNLFKINTGEKSPSSC
jgi:hypothetical protein